MAFESFNPGLLQVNPSLLKNLDQNDNISDAIKNYMQIQQQKQAIQSQIQQREAQQIQLTEAIRTQSRNDSILKAKQSAVDWHRQNPDKTFLDYQNYYNQQLGNVDPGLALEHQSIIQKSASDSFADYADKYDKSLTAGVFTNPDGTTNTDNITAFNSQFSGNPFLSGKLFSGGTQKRTTEGESFIYDPSGTGHKFYTIGNQFYIDDKQVSSLPSGWETASQRNARLSSTRVEDRNVNEQVRSFRTDTITGKRGADYISTIESSEKAIALLKEPNAVSQMLAVYGLAKTADPGGRLTDQDIQVVKGVPGLYNTLSRFVGQNVNQINLTPQDVNSIKSALDTSRLSIAGQYKAYLDGETEYQGRALKTKPGELRSVVEDQYQLVNKILSEKNNNNLKTFDSPKAAAASGLKDGDIYINSTGQKVKLKVTR